ncbi:MAG: hypothetical protein JWM09_608 [Francisellaceae bacterium]|nr:hypothetical protein [Francisellaceae bacterium]
MLKIKFLQKGAILLLSLIMLLCLSILGIMVLNISLTSNKSVSNTQDALMALQLADNAVAQARAKIFPYSTSRTGPNTSINPDIHYCTTAPSLPCAGAALTGVSPLTTINPIDPTTQNANWWATNGTPVAPTKQKSVSVSSSYIIENICCNPDSANSVNKNANPYDIFRITGRGVGNDPNTIIYSKAIVKRFPIQSLPITNVSGYTLSSLAQISFSATYTTDGQNYSNLPNSNTNATSPFWMTRSMKIYPENYYDNGGYTFWNTYCPTIANNSSDPDAQYPRANYAAAWCETNCLGQVRVRAYGNNASLSPNASTPCEVISGPWTSPDNNYTSTIYIPTNINGSIARFICTITLPFVPAGAINSYNAAACQ